MKAFNNILHGKPVFENEADPSATPQEVTEASVPSNGSKLIPVVRVTRTKAVVSGQRMEVYLNIRNESSAKVFLDKIRLLGTTRELDVDLAPGQVRDLLVYAGPRLQNERVGGSEVQYHKEGDYFVAQHAVRTRRESDGMFTVDAFELITPIKDVPF